MFKSKWQKIKFCQYSFSKLKTIKTNVLEWLSPSSFVNRFDKLTCLVGVRHRNAFDWPNKDSFTFSLWCKLPPGFAHVTEKDENRRHIDEYVKLENIRWGIYIYQNLFANSIRNHSFFFHYKKNLNRYFTLKYKHDNTHEILSNHRLSFYVGHWSIARIPK